MKHRSQVSRYRAGSFRRRSALVSSVLMLVGLVAGVGSQPDSVSAASDLGGQITSPEVMARADYVYQQAPPYNSAPIWDLGHTAQYRNDCSGFSDMALHLAADPNTTDIPGYSGGGGSYFDRIMTANHSLTPDQVQPGDVFDDVTDHHAFLFEGWDWDGVHFSYYNFGGGASQHDPPEHHVGETFAAQQVGFEDVGNYVIYRYHNLVNLGYNALAPAVAVTPGGHAYAFWQGTNGLLYEADGPAGGDLGNLTHRDDLGTLGSAPTVGTDRNGSTYVYWRGSGSGHDLWESHWDPASRSWTPAKDQGFGPLGSAPSTAVTPDGHAYVFWTGTNGDLYEADGPAAGALGNLSHRSGMGTLGSAPAAAVDGNGSTYVYWRGAGSSHDLYEAHWDPQSKNWIGPTSQGMGPLGSAPSVAMTPDGHAYVFWTGTNGDLYEAGGPGSALGDQHDRGYGYLGSAPAVGVDSSGATYVYWKGSGDLHNLTEAFWNGTDWVNTARSQGMGPLG